MLFSIDVVVDDEDDVVVDVDYDDGQWRQRCFTRL